MQNQPAAILYKCSIQVFIKNDVFHYLGEFSNSPEGSNKHSSQGNRYIIFMGRCVCPMPTNYSYKSFSLLVIDFKQKGTVFLLYILCICLIMSYPLNKIHHTLNYQLRVPSVCHYPVLCSSESDHHPQQCASEGLPF